MEGIPLLLSKNTNVSSVSDEKWANPCILTPLQKAVRVTTLMKRLRAPEQGESGASSPTPGAAAGPLTSNSGPAPPTSAPGTASSSTEQASAKEQVPDTDTGVIQAPTVTAARDEEEAGERRNGQTPAQTLGDKTA